MDHIVDWQRRRILTRESSKVCVHGELLIVWCRGCGLDLDAISDERTTDDAA